MRAADTSRRCSSRLADRFPFPRQSHTEYVARLNQSRDRIIDAICHFNAQLYVHPQTPPVPPPPKKTGHSRKRRFTNQEERIIIEFVEQPSFDSGREMNGHTCYDLKSAAEAWCKLKHPKPLPQTAEEFRLAYKNIIDRHRKLARMLSGAKR